MNYVNVLGIIHKQSETTMHDVVEQTRLEVQLEFCSFFLNCITDHI